MSYCVNGTPEYSQAHP